jgi:hypothetical protein
MADGTLGSQASPCHFIITVLLEDSITMSFLRCRNRGSHIIQASWGQVDLGFETSTGSSSWATLMLPGGVDRASSNGTWKWDIFSHNMKVTGNCPIRSERVMEPGFALTVPTPHQQEGLSGTRTADLLHIPGSLLSHFP